MQLRREANSIPEKRGAAGVEMSSHLFPEVSAHLLAATPTCHWLDCVDWAEPILTQPLEIKDRMAIVPDQPGTGLEWDVEAVNRFRFT
jgi:mandelate racemase